jgi:polysaccharide export outer membrane protein
VHTRVFAAIAALFVGPAVASAQDYLLGPGDTIRVAVFGEPTLSRTLQISQACQVDIELIGAVPVCGATPDAVASVITAKLADGYLVSPSVIVEIAEYGSQRVEVRGAAATPGMITLKGPTPLTEVISMAGGPAQPSVVDVEHAPAGGQATAYPLSQLYVTRDPVLVKGGDTVYLRPGRNVYVDGEVATEGPIAYREGMTVTQAITLAGGPSAYASRRRVIVLRGSGERVAVDLAAVRRGRLVDPVLQPDDRITLPRSWF